MKYIKLGAIVAQSINAGCNCCEEKKALDEFCKYFGVSKDYVLDTITNHYIDDKAKELMKENGNLKYCVCTKHICKKGEAITQILLSETFKLNTEDLVECNIADLANAMKNKENVIIYEYDIDGVNKLYKKK